MTTTCQDIILRAKAMSPLNAGLTADSVEMLTRIRSIQERVFVATAQLSRTRFATVDIMTSTNAASGRSIDLTTLTQPLMRILKVWRSSDGIEVRQVPEADQNSQLSPRYYVRGTTMWEVGSDWSTSSGTVDLDVQYAYGPTSININGSTSSINVSIPDEHIDVLIYPLAMYLHQKDTGRDPAEYQQLDSQYRDAWQSFLDYLTNYGGDVSRRLVPPTPPAARQG